MGRKLHSTHLRLPGNTEPPEQGLPVVLDGFLAYLLWPLVQRQQKASIANGREVPIEGLHPAPCVASVAVGGRQPTLVGGDTEVFGRARAPVLGTPTVGDPRAGIFGARIPLPELIEDRPSSVAPLVLGPGCYVRIECLITILLSGIQHVLGPPSRRASRWTDCSPHVGVQDVRLQPVRPVLDAGTQHRQATGQRSRNTLFCPPARHLEAVVLPICICVAPVIRHSRVVLPQYVGQGHPAQHTLAHRTVSTMPEQINIRCRGQFLCAELTQWAPEAAEARSEEACVAHSVNVLFQHEAETVAPQPNFAWAFTRPAYGGYEPCLGHGAPGSRGKSVAGEPASGGRVAGLVVKTRLAERLQDGLDRTFVNHSAKQALEGFQYLVVVVTRPRVLPVMRQVERDVDHCAHLRVMLGRKEDEKRIGLAICNWDGNVPLRKWQTDCGGKALPILFVRPGPSTPASRFRTSWAFGCEPHDPVGQPRIGAVSPVNSFSIRTDHAKSRQLRHKKHEQGIQVLELVDHGPFHGVVLQGKSDYRCVTGIEQILDRPVGRSGMGYAERERWRVGVQAFLLEQVLGFRCGEEEVEWAGIDFRRLRELKHRLESQPLGADEFSAGTVIAHGVDGVLQELPQEPATVVAAGLVFTSVVGRNAVRIATICLQFARLDTSHEVFVRTPEVVSHLVI